MSEPTARSSLSVSSAPETSVPETSPQRHRLWSRDFILASLTNFLIAMVFYLLITAMALYAVDRFMASDASPVSR